MCLVDFSAGQLERTDIDPYSTHKHTHQPVLPMKCINLLFHSFCIVIQLNQLIHLKIKLFVIVFASKYEWHWINSNTVYEKQTKREEKRNILIYFHGNIQKDAMANGLFCEKQEVLFN